MHVSRHELAGRLSKQDRHSAAGTTAPLLQSCAHTSLQSFRSTSLPSGVESDLMRQGVSLSCPHAAWRLDVLVAAMADGIQMQPTNGRPASPTKRRPEGKEGLLSQKPPPLNPREGCAASRLCYFPSSCGISHALAKRTVVAEYIIADILVSMQTLQCKTSAFANAGGWLACGTASHSSLLRPSWGSSCCWSD